ncbi:hypothetical protein [Nocardia huaxiensis]|uniref:DUF3558 domain-containing protein n=1 Tax=Nocardia huaxiensis TaxID=2755382 RepID=A0A7D6ZL12_9NOCA|nr:hypothetical protein [Nocardia huaxiensis]QLY28165.1 hypothetical protein H0264_22520 [Nocardia huaxiensis]UFS98389.1 hypothetical protein LPY97_11055 [Nocardia huaxiensis]
MSSMRGRLPWAVAAVSVLVLAAVVVFAVVVLSGGDDKNDAGKTTVGNGTTFEPGSHDPRQAGKYKPGKVENACNAVDLAAIVAMGYPAAGKPLHEETNSGGVGGSLECRADFENASFSAQANYDWGGDSGIFEESKANEIANPSANTTAAAISGLGESAYYMLEDASSGTRTDIEATVHAKDDNLVVVTILRVSGYDIHANRDEVRQAAEAQARLMLERLR